MKVTIEEIVSQEFEVPDGSTLEDIRSLYKEEKLVLNNPSLVEANVLMDVDESWIRID